MLENSKIQISVTRKVLHQHCTGVERGKMRGEQNFPTLMAKVVARELFSIITQAIIEMYAF